MAKPKKPVKKSKTSGITPFWNSSWLDIDRSIENFRAEMEKAFNSFPKMHFPKMQQTSCDVVDEGKQFRVVMDVPGVKKNEIKLNVTENSLEVSAQHKEESEEKKKNYLQKERSQVSFYRTLPLPDKVVSGNTKAKLTDGILEIILPKIKPTSKPKKRTVSVQ